MKKLTAILLSITMTSAIAYENGDVVLTNTNLADLNTNDVIQFELHTNNEGLVQTKSLSANSPLNQQVLTHWSFSDQTTYFDVWIRNLSRGQLDYVSCNLERINYDHHAVMMIDGYSDGKTVGCRIRNQR